MNQKSSIPQDQRFVSQVLTGNTQFVGPIMRSAYLSPDVLERLLLWREAPSATLLQMIEATYLPWSEQMARVFDGKPSTARDLEP